MHDSGKHHRRSLRLHGYDYSQAGMYFVTVCTCEKKCILGDIRGAQTILSKAGEAVPQTWLELPYRFPPLQLEAFVVMPNHVHGVLVNVGAGLALPRGAASSAPTNLRPSLGRIVRAFKSLSAIAVNSVLRQSGSPVWQRNYYEHIIRGGDDLDEIRRYIADNPLKWGQDPENPTLQARS